MKKIGAFRMNMVFCTRKVFFYGLLFMLPALFIFDCRLGLERFASPVNTLNLLYLGFGASASASLRGTGRSGFSAQSRPPCTSTSSLW